MTPATGLGAGAMIGRYRVERLLGRGGMGSVYAAFDTRLQRLVALKVISRSGRELDARFEREARLLATFSHPNAVVVHDVGETDETLYIAMELVDGLPLSAHVRSAASATERIRWLVDTGRALDAAHRAGLVHRDVKPDNVMLTRSGVIKVIDFGIARRVDPDAADPTITAEGRVIGTPLYMAPEQLRGDQVDARADQFAWGVMAYELLAHQIPWRHASDVVAVIAEIVSGPPPPLQERAADVSREVAAIVERAMQSDPGRRFPTMAAAVAALLSSEGLSSSTPAAPASAPAPVRAGPVATPEAFAPTVTLFDGGRPRRRRVVAVAVAAVLGVATIAAGLLRARAPQAVAPASAPASTEAAGPAPSACSPEAQKLYDEGDEVFATHSTSGALTYWRDAAKLDPGCARAHLRLAMGRFENGLSLPEARAEFLAAQRNQERLTPVERAELSAIAPAFSAVPTFVEVLERLRATSRAFPADGLVAYMHGSQAGELGHDDEALRELRRAIEVRPRFHSAYAILAERDDVNRREILLRCLEQTPASLWCREETAYDLRSGFDCAALERFAREYVATEPGSGAQSTLADALIAVNAPSEAIQEALASEPSDNWLSVFKYKVAAGDYLAAEAVARAAPDGSVQDYAHRAHHAEWLAEVLDETGRPGEGVTLITATYRASRAMAPVDDPGEIAGFLARAVDAGAVSKADVLALLSRPAEGPPRPFFSWLRGARLARTSAEARAVLERMPTRRERAYREAEEEQAGAVDLQLGELHALAGDWATARRDADAAVRRCDHVGWPLGVPGAYALLGEASEKTGELAAAREAYETIVRRWGHLKPHAVRAENARARLAALPKR